MGVKELQNNWEINQRTYTCTTQQQQKTKCVLNHNKVIATNVVVDENTCQVLFDEILMLASEHFARFGYGRARLPCKELQSHTVDSLDSSTQIIYSHSQTVSVLEGTCAYTSIQRIQEELCEAE